jgi:hypothetical protein
VEKGIGRSVVSTTYAGGGTQETTVEEGMEELERNNEFV